MLMRKLGRTGLRVAALCLGGNTFGWTTDQAASEAVLDAYVEAGGNFIDTADIYARWATGKTGGESEAVLGTWMAARGNRHAVLIATKVMGPMGSGPNDTGLSRKHIMDAVDASLRRLQTDYIDEVEPGFVEPLVAAVAADPSCAAACAQILFEGEPPRIWYAGAPFRARRGHSGRNVGYGQPPFPPATPPYATDRACGGAMLVTDEVSRRVGLFDDDLFAYAEDTDWSLRARREGLRCVVVPASVVRHAVSGSSGGEASPTSIYYSLRNSLVVAERWAPLGVLGTWLRRLEAVAAHVAQVLLSGRRADGLKAVIAAWRDFRRGRLGVRP